MQMMSYMKKNQLYLFFNIGNGSSTPCCMNTYKRLERDFKQFTYIGNYSGSAREFSPLTPSHNNVFAIQKLCLTIDIMYVCVYLHIYNFNNFNIILIINVHDS